MNASIVGRCASHDCDCLVARDLAAYAADGARGVVSDETLDPMWLAFSQLPIVDTRSPEQKARFEAGLAEIRERRYERPARRPR